ncbi:protoheme IX farnesyltransferase [Sulfuritortus calidifontis]|uniref:Protoheme IX farnesyltransferase n=1 Tax=Sulfuritortus calidifontis TaxID=1914471 RepID=A0A4V6NYS5_9PROT|nr:heme o synthase [Sulfuritortus calidifontis]TCS73406.1 protoheme IX farnesyltransferase [Sulfuritortus calidifontis]
MEMVTVWNRARLRDYLELTKPRVVALIVFTAVIGMFLAQPGWPPLGLLLAATAGIALAAAGAAAFNCLVERTIDAKMARTRARATARGEVGTVQALVFAGLLAGAGLSLLYVWVNPLTMWLTLLTFIGYACIYTLFLKPATPQNIVIGGASGAMPPVLGWAAMTGTVGHEALLLFLIIFAWTPPHFWALALYRKDDYARSGLPMLPVTHGEAFTRLNILLYTVLLSAVTLLPVAVNMVGPIYVAAVLALDGVFLWFAWRLYRAYSAELAKRTFAYSILYLSLLFAALLLDRALAV